MNNIKIIMRTFIAALLILIFIAAVTNNTVIIQQVSLDANNINAWFYNTGIFDQDLRTSNTPGLEWPKGSGKFAVFTAGLSCGAYVQDSLREFMNSYKGELAPGYIIDSLGNPTAKTDSRFKIYSVKRTDNPGSMDWLNWGTMIPYGAPYIDVNHSGTYEPSIDTPGIKCASQTLFVCLTDGFPEEHKVGEGFGGGTNPLYAEIRLTAWCYDIPGLQDIQYIKWQVINKNKYLWDSTFFAITCDQDLGNPNDDYVGCDTISNMGYCYNSDNDDENYGSNHYGLNPPAVGFKLIRSAKNNSGQNIGMTSFAQFIGTSTPGAVCEKDPNGEPFGAYNMMKGLKKDRTPWVIPPGGNASYVTKFIYSGNPETGQGWNEGPPGNPTGSILNCGGDSSYTGTIIAINPSGDRRIILSSGSKSLKVNPGDTQIIVSAQLVARGSSNLNSVTKLKQLSDIAQIYYDSAYVKGLCDYPIGVNNNSYEIPQQYNLYQNYPNPFNPTTKIRFSLPKFISPLEGGRGGDKIVLKVYDVLGREIVTLIDEDLKPGQYEVEWNASNFSSGVYFYQLKVNDYTETKRMVLLK